MSSRKHDYRRLLAALCAFSGAFAGADNSFATGNKSGKESTKASGAKNDSIGNIVLGLYRKHPVAAGTLTGVGASAVIFSIYLVGKKAGIWGNPQKYRKPDPEEEPDENPDEQVTPFEMVLGGSLAFHKSLAFLAYSYDWSKNVWLDQYFYHSRGATNKTMRKAILKEMLFKNDDSEDAEKALVDYLDRGGAAGRSEYVIFRLEPCAQDQPGKYVIVFDARLLAKMSSAQKTAIQDKVYERGGFAVLGVTVQESKQNQGTSYGCSIKNLGELGYNFNFYKDCYVFNKKEDNVAIKNRKLENSLFELFVDSLTMYSSSKKKGTVSNNIKQQFITSLNGFNAKAGNDKQVICDNSALYDIGGTRLLVFNNKCKSVFCDLFKDKFFVLGGYGFVVFEKNDQNTWDVADFGDKYKITSKKDVDFGFDFEIAKPN
ncbi:MAG: hypothetical protein J6P21_03780 [Clostridia bacterium]|nr:hypothetical protein [Clostridia bacterium]